MLLSVLCTLLCPLLRALLPRASSARGLEVEVLVLRHENRVLRRHTKRARRCPIERVFLVALSPCLPRAEWGRFPVRPEMLLRWHRNLVRLKWATFGRRRGPGRPPLAKDLEGLILRLARENSRRGFATLTVARTVCASCRPVRRADAQL